MNVDVPFVEDFIPPTTESALSDVDVPFVEDFVPPTTESALSD